MVTLYTDPRMLDHSPPRGHPESPERLRAITGYLHRTGLTALCDVGNVREATDAELVRVHHPEYIAELTAMEEQGRSQIEADTFLNPGSNRAARLAAGAAVEAVRQVLAGPDSRALCLVRPPGHHARPGGAMGFCLFDNVAVAAAEAIANHGLERVLIVDFDVHHGNGTQEIFYEDPRVGFLSIHRSPFYPGTGAADETGTGAALGHTRNIPLPFGIPRATYHAAFREGLETLADRIRPELILISAGFDAHAADPIGSLGLEVEDFASLTRDVVDVAQTHASGRVVSLLEGGYNTRILAECVAAHLETLLLTERRP